MGGVPGVAPANVAVLGGGSVGSNAVKIAVGMGAHVTVLDINHDRLTYLDDIYHGGCARAPATSTTSRRSSSTPTW